MLKDFPPRLKALRKEFGLNQTEMAHDLDLSPSGYQCYEQGRGYPDVPRLYQLAEYFGVSIDYLLGRTEKREINQ
jgi:transcriptional regulator with XRE-family HTH domain